MFSGKHSLHFGGWNLHHPNLGGMGSQGGGHISLPNTEIGPHRPCVRCAAIWITRLVFIRITFVPRVTSCENWPRSLNASDWRLTIFWSRRYAERIWGEIFVLVRRSLGKLPANFSANFDGEFFGLVFSRVSGHPKNSCPKFTFRIVGIPLQFSLSWTQIYSQRFSAYRGDQEFAHLS